MAVTDSVSALQDVPNDEVWQYAGQSELTGPGYMNDSTGSADIQPGALYVVATPIGNLADISQRALQVLGAVSMIAAEDTRHSRKLLDHYHIATPLSAFHEHSDAARLQGLLGRLQQGDSLALISDAGTPLISDPGYQLVRQARQAGIQVIPVPGACAVTAALSASGLPSDRFTFEGFLPAKEGARRNALLALADEARTMIFYEAPHRICACLQDMIAVFGAERPAVLARELTKTFETIHDDNLAALARWVEQDSNQQRGEIVLLVQGAARREADIDPEAERILGLLLAELPLKQAVALAASITGQKKNALYQKALELTGKG